MPQLTDVFEAVVRVQKLCPIRERRGKITRRMRNMQTDAKARDHVT